MKLFAGNGNAYGICPRLFLVAVIDINILIGAANICHELTGRGMFVVIGVAVTIFCLISSQIHACICHVKRSRSQMLIICRGSCIKKGIRIVEGHSCIISITVGLLVPGKSTDQIIFCSLNAIGAYCPDYACPGPVIRNLTTIIYCIPRRYFGRCGRSSNRLSCISIITAVIDILDLSAV